MSHNIALVNITDGSVQGHKAGCADLSRGKLRRHADQVWNMEVETKHEAWVAYNGDFLAEGPESGQYEIQWLPCAKHVPQGTEDTYEAWEAESLAGIDKVWDAESEHGQIAEVVAPVSPTTTVKRGTKWTYVYVDGELVAEIRNDQVALLAAI